MKSLKGHFTRTIGRPDAPLHFAAHSHHPWPDVTLAAHSRAWLDAAELLDRKWDKVFGTVMPAAQRHIARLLDVPDPSTIVFAPNTHDFVRRLLSCLPAGCPRILTTDGEFHSFSRQIDRLAEDGLVAVTRIPTEPFDSFSQRFAGAARAERHDLVFFSTVFFNSAFALPDKAAIVDAVTDPETLIVFDGYHEFMARPVSLAGLCKRVFYLAGGYKYAMAGEGACFMHCPPGYGPRPRDTGWYAEFDTLGHARSDETAYGTSGLRFAGSTFDPSGLYRFNAVQDWLIELGERGSVDAHTAYCARLQATFLECLKSRPGPIGETDLVVPQIHPRGRFLTFRTPQAGAIATALAEAGIIVDHRGDRLRIGFGVYQNEADVDRLATTIAAPTLA